MMQWPRDCRRINARLDLLAPSSASGILDFDFLRQFVYFALQFRQAMEDCNGFEPLLIFKRWNAGVNGFGGTSRGTPLLAVMMAPSPIF